ncbi:hypothetical protein BpHYR1_054468 [Brachionus plicatilis]|uniref:Uncharacterized protein n=1 Tax=Brachionus plicatilis TaxID=10195 RepID=A0A3M7PJG7_BRAPC|nr:hypothetical protein BpHYR1_054468 [Brachionus plicatilis]
MTRSYREISKTSHFDMSNMTCLPGLKAKTNSNLNHLIFSFEINKLIEMINHSLCWRPFVRIVEAINKKTLLQPTNLGTTRCAVCFKINSENAEWCNIQSCINYNSLLMIKISELEKKLPIKFATKSKLAVTFFWRFTSLGLSERYEPSFQPAFN